MGAFLEEYGKIIVVIIVIAALMGLALLFRLQGRSNATYSFDAFMEIANNNVKVAEKDATSDINSLE